MKVVYAQQDFPEEWKYSVFLAGPTPRDKEVKSWRPEALKILEEMGYDGVVFVPEGENWSFPEDGTYEKQLKWEKQGLHMADAVVFWIPRDLETMPGFTTNVEFGHWVSSVKTIALGFPDDAKKTRYLQDMAEGFHVPVGADLETTLKFGVKGWKDAPLRKGGERYVPLAVWGTPQFQLWYDNLKKMGNRLDEADLLWGFKMPKARFIFSWVLWVKVWIEAEERYKENEFVFARTDISTVMLYRDPEPRVNEIDTLEFIEVILVREFRSPARTPDGFIHELAGGSSMKPDADPLETASEEIHEETGLSIAADRLKFLGSRQVAGTLSSHHAHLYAAALTEAEMDDAKLLAASGKAHGVVEDSERTYVEVTTVGELLDSETVDWSTLGMIFKGLMGS